MDTVPNPAVAKSLQELRYALVATVLTLVSALALYQFIPGFQDSLQSSSGVLKHERSYQMSENGGSIIYSFSDANASDSYKQDLEILSRRFARGQFEMLAWHERLGYRKKIAK